MDPAFEADAPVGFGPEALLVEEFVGEGAVESLGFAVGLGPVGAGAQTVIIMVVLVVIAGAAATILVSRAGTETERLEDADSDVDAAEYGSKTLCEQADHTWTPATTDGGGNVTTPGACSS